MKPKGKDKSPAVIQVSDGRIRSVTKKVLELFGYAKDDLSGLHFEDFIAPDFRNIVSNNYSKMVAGNITRVHFKIDVLAKNGAAIPAEINASVSASKAGPVVTAVIRTIRPTKATTSNIRQLFTSARCLIWNATVKRKKGKFLWNITIANEDACRQFLPLKISKGQSTGTPGGLPFSRKTWPTWTLRAPMPC